MVEHTLIKNYFFETQGATGLLTSTMPLRYLTVFTSNYTYNLYLHIDVLV